MMDNSTPTTIIIFGGSGDLTRRKLIPALFNLYIKDRLPANCNIVGTARSKLDSTEFRRLMRASVKEFFQGEFSTEKWETFEKRLHYIPGSYSEETEYTKLNKALEDIEGETAYRLYYLATPPQFFGEIIAQLGNAGMVQEKSSDKAGELPVWRKWGQWINPIQPIL